MENVALWHERDISHSAVERTILPDACISCDYALNRLAGLIEKLLVYPETMKANLDRLGGLHFSQKVMLSLTQKGVSREDAYRMVQRNAMKVWGSAAENGNLATTTLRSELENDPEVAEKLNGSDLDEIFDLTPYTKNIDFVFGRVFG